MDNENTGRSQSYEALIGPALAGIPAVGGPLSAMWSEWNTNRRFARVEDTLSELQRLVGADRYDIDPDALADPQLELFDKAIRHAQREHAEKKRRLFARFVASSWSAEYVEDSPEDGPNFLNALIDFTDKHIYTLLSLEEAGGDAAVSYEELCDAVYEQVASHDDNNEKMLGVLDILGTRYGFIKRAWGLNDPDYDGSIFLTSNLSPEGVARGCSHCITSLGKRFLDYIRDTEEEGGLDGYVTNNE